MYRLVERKLGKSVSSYPVPGRARMTYSGIFSRI